MIGRRWWRRGARLVQITRPELVRWAQQLQRG